MKSPNFRRRLIHLHQPWVHAALGSAMILLSTLATGAWVYQIQNRIDRTKEALAIKTDQLEQTVRYEDFAQLLSTLGIMQDSGPRGPSDAALPASKDTSRVLMEFQAAARLSGAAGNPTFDYSVVDRALAQAKRGDVVGALEAAQALHKRFLVESFNYKLSLEREIAPLHIQLRSLDRARNRLAYVALILQIAGLVLLLLKELPANSNVKAEE